MLTIDRSLGEGGGQILRTALALSLITGTPLRIEKIRGRRRNPGLLSQHLTAVQAAAAVGHAEVEGAALRANEIVFRPGSVRPGEYRFSVGTAGSACLVLLTILPALLVAAEPSLLTMEGGTHNPAAPPFDFLDRVFFPLLARMGFRVRGSLERPGFYPAGGGRFTVHVEPALRRAPLTLLERGRTRRRRAQAAVARLARHIAERELAVVGRQLGWSAGELEVVGIEESAGPGNVVMLEIESEHVTELFTGFGKVKVRAEMVAERAVQEARGYLAADVPVGRHLADQLLLPLALAGGGSFRTLPLSAHSTTNIDVLQRFLDVKITTAVTGGAMRLEMTTRS